MKRDFIKLTVVAVIAIGTFTACEKENGSSNSGSDSESGSFVIESTNVINSNNNIATVKGCLWTEGEGDNDEEEWWTVIATGQYGKGGFKLTLPDNVNSKYLEYATDLFNDESISDNKAKTMYLNEFWIGAYGKAGKAMGMLQCLGANSNIFVYVNYMYADRKFTYKETDDDYEANCTFNKGWNAVYFYEESRNGNEYYGMTTQKPSGVTLKWEYTEGIEVP